MINAQIFKIYRRTKITIMKISKIAENELVIVFFSATSFNYLDFHRKYFKTCKLSYFLLFCLVFDFWNFRILEFRIEI